jgi:hypothetical protein
MGVGFALSDRSPAMTELMDALFSRGTFLSACIMMALVELMAGLYTARW